MVSTGGGAGTVAGYQLTDEVRRSGWGTADLVRGISYRGADELTDIGDSWPVSMSRQLGVELAYSLRHRSSWIAGQGVNEDPALWLGRWLGRP